MRFSEPALLIVVTYSYSSYQNMFLDLSFAKPAVRMSLFNHPVASVTEARLTLPCPVVTTVNSYSSTVFLYKHFLMV